MEKNIIKIQRYYRIHKLNTYFNNFEKYNMNKKNLTFSKYINNMQNKKIINSVNQIINNLNKLCNTNYNISSKLILTSYLITNYTNDIIGPIKDRHPMDTFIIDWSKKLVSIFKFEKTLDKYKLMINYLNNYVEIFNNWKFMDKNRTIQNIIISYGNRIDHINYTTNEKMEETTKKNILDELKKEADELLCSLKLIDNSFDIENLKVNYKKIIEDIQISMEQIFNELSYNFKNTYLDILIEEYKNDNTQIILNLINETNDRILKLTPKDYVNSTRSKLLSYDYTEYLLSDDFNLLHPYFIFLIDTIIMYSSPDQDENNNELKEEVLSWLNLDADLDYKILIPSLLIEINGKIDIIINRLNILI